MHHAASSSSLEQCVVDHLIPGTHSDKARHGFTKLGCNQVIEVEIG